MAAQPCSIGDMQAYVDGQSRDMRSYVDGQRFLTIDLADSAFDKFLKEQTERFITTADLRRLGYAPADDVRTNILEIVQRENS